MMKERRRRKKNGTKFKYKSRVKEDLVSLRAKRGYVCDERVVTGVS